MFICPPKTPSNCQWDRVYWNRCSILIIRWKFSYLNSLGKHFLFTQKIKSRNKVGRLVLKKGVLNWLGPLEHEDIWAGKSCVSSGAVGKLSQGEFTEELRSEETVVPVTNSKPSPVLCFLVLTLRFSKLHSPSASQQPIRVPQGEARCRKRRKSLIIPAFLPFFTAQPQQWPRTLASSSRPHFPAFFYHPYPHHSLHIPSAPVAAGAVPISEVSGIHKSPMASTPQKAARPLFKLQLSKRPPFPFTQP